MLTKLLDFVVGREPVATATGLAGLVTAVLGLAATFGADITAEQIAAVGALAAALAGWLARKAVSPVHPSYGDLPKKESPFDIGVLDAETELGRNDPERGGIILFVLLGLGALVVMGLAFDACFDNESEDNDLGAPAWVTDHEGDGGCWDGECYDEGGYYDDGGGGGQEYDQNYGSRDDRNRNRNRNRGAFSPGPFDDSPVDAFNGNIICLPGSTCTPEEDRRRDEPPPDRRRA